MSERLYYNDSFLCEFEAKVIACEPIGDRFHVVLDRTAFYPTSGGQPHDSGRLGEAAVVEVLDREDDMVVHVTDRALALGPVHGTIDWQRRFGHMQQHTGQHLLSAAFVELFKMQTVSFHLGGESSSIDVAGATLSIAHAEEAERRTNQIIFEDRAVDVRYGTREELAASGVRKEVDREGVLRAVSVEQFDLQPCGGTHVMRTGQVGLLLHRKVERQNQNWRVEFVCGWRAIRAARADFAALNDAARMLSCGPPVVPSMLGKALDEREQAQRSRQQLLDRLAGYEAQELLRAAKSGPTRVVLHICDNAKAAYLRVLATRLVAEPSVIALLATRTEGHVVFAQSPGLATDMSTLLREALNTAGGKGGGTHDFAQGSVPDAARIETILSTVAARLNQA